MIFSFLNSPMNRNQSLHPQTSPILADIIRVDTCDSRRSTNPIPGLSPAYTTVPGYRSVVPAGTRCPGVPPFYRALAPAGAGDEGARKTANYPPPFRHIPNHPQPRPTTTVWRNPEQHVKPAMNPLTGMRPQPLYMPGLSPSPQKKRIRKPAFLTLDQGITAAI